MHETPVPESLWRLLRPLHWTKNLFILVPIPFAIAAQQGGPWSLGVTLLGVSGFSALASAVYAFNDVWDRRSDRQHPRKRLRPVAAGAISPGRALSCSAVLVVVGLLLCAATGRDGAVAIGGTYLALQLFYTLLGKRVPLVDVFLLALGYVLRVVFGCALAAATPSSWLLLCTSALALFLGLAKRRADLQFGTSHRPALRGYDVRFVDQALAISGGGALVCYALYAMDAQVLIRGREFWGVPFVAFGILEYLRLVHCEGEGGTPVETLLRTPTLWLCVLGWAVATYLGLA
ncbi:MAG: UbiA prenyltransferase family protein [Planctomycetota bacterium]